MKKQKMNVVFAILLVFILAISAVVYSSSQKKPHHLSNPTSGGELNIQLGLDQDSFRLGDTIKFKSYITNPSQETKSYTFNSTCSQGTLHIDEKPTQQVQVCGQAITPVDISPGETISYDYEFNLVDKFSSGTDVDIIEFEGELKLTPGSHQAQLDWQGVKSDLLFFSFE